MPKQDRLRVAALIDLPRSPKAGGHVKCWERLAASAADGSLPLDFTVYFSGEEKTEELGPHATIRQLPPVFSTSRLKFLPYVPDHTDLAPYHAKLAKELQTFDVLHTTDAFFAFARTAERISRTYDIPLVTSFHTDTPAYTRIFTRQTIERKLGSTWLGRKMLDDWHVPEWQGHLKEKRLKKHVSRCTEALVTREEDHRLAAGILGQNHVHPMRLGVDRSTFGPHNRDRIGIERELNLSPGKIIALFVGRVDIGKNIFMLTEAVENLVREGVPLHLIVAGVGPAMEDVEKRLGPHASVLGFVPPDKLARLYASVDLLAITSEVEIRSMVGVEAMTSGCPTLVSKKSGVAELFNHTPAMRTVESDVGSWTKTLHEFANDPQAREKMRKAAIDHGQKHLASWRDVLAEDLFATWQQAVRG